MSAPFEVAEFDILFGQGINAQGCVLDVAKDLGVLEARVSRAGIRVLWVIHKVCWRVLCVSTNRL